MQQLSPLSSSQRLVWRKGTPSSTRFDNALLRELPVLDAAQDAASEEQSSADCCFKRVKGVKQMENPQLVMASTDALQLAGFDVERTENREERRDEHERMAFVPMGELVPFLVGSDVLHGSELALECCSIPKSVDGDAIYVGEVVNEAQERWELQLHLIGLRASSGENDSEKRGLVRTSVRFAWQDMVISH